MRIIAFFTVLLATLAAVAPAAESRKPNVILILMDDMGWRDVGFAGNKYVETPNIDRLAKRGVVFTQSYASAPNCAPTRACLMSGLYTPRHGIYTVVDPRQPPNSPWQKLKTDSKSELATEFVTMAEAMQAGGYATGFFGMWNLGRGRQGPVTPGGQGFQTVVFPENIGFAKDAYFDSKGNYLSDRLTDEVIRFVEQNKDKPFFAYYPDHAVHAPFEPKQDLLKKYQQKRQGENDRRESPAYAATIEAVDQNVGRIVAALDRLKLTDNTLIIFTSDNGGTPEFTAPLRGSKGQLYEGGIRVPLAIAGPGVTKPGSVCESPVASIDLYPTLLDLAGITPPANVKLDGTSLKPVLQGGPALADRPLFWHFPCYVGRATPTSAMRQGDYKLVQSFEDGTLELFNLRKDPEEKTNLATQEPDRLATMKATLQTWQRETTALMPDQPNPAYDPKAERPRGGGGGGAGAGGGGGRNRPKQN